LDHTHIEEIVSVLRDSCLTEMEVRQGSATLRLRRPPEAAPGALPAGRPPDAALPAPQTVIQTLTDAEYASPVSVAVTAGLVGVFHALPDPVAEGMGVDRRQLLGQIESMRLMNDCLAPSAGRVLAVWVEDGQPVEYGQPLFEIVPEEL
jgi:acetyl-CoA carboxylase biotin carboxyl carrier protein